MRPDLPKERRGLVDLSHEPQIILTWLLRLRWLAVAGQVLAITVAHEVLELRIALLPIGVVIAITMVSNLLLMLWMQRHGATAALVPAILVLDVCLLTALLYCTGGASNPFSILYIVHIGMSVVVLGAGWTWLIVIISSLSYALLFRFHLPLEHEQPIPPAAVTLGEWTAFVLVAVLIGYFVGRVTRALRRRERELSIVRERAARTEQLASLTTLAAGAAHELGTPLGTIAVIAKELELASSAGQANGSVQEDARLIRDEVDRCRAILDRMRVDLIEDLHQKWAIVSVDELLARLSRDLGEDAVRRLHVIRPQALRHVAGPIRAIEQALSVLLRNAFDATPPDKVVRLEIGRSSNRTLFTVQDSGPGMTEQILRRAGQPFFTTKPPGKGMGLGLFLVRLIAQRYGGHFSLRSTPGQGTTSVFDVPDAVSVELGQEEAGDHALKDSRGR